MNGAMAQPFEGDIFKAQQRKSAVETVIETVRDLLINKQLKRGDRLPNEIELTKRLATSRGTLREAMKILSSFGIIEIKRGNGTFISHSMSDRLFDHLVFQMILSDTDKKKLTELREMIEIGIVKLVISNATDEDIARIRDAYDLMAGSLGRPDSESESMTELDLRFHHAVGMATKNELIRKVYEFTLDLVEPSIRETYRHSDNKLNALKAHEDILKGLVARDRERAEAAVRESIKEWTIHST